MRSPPPALVVVLALGAGCGACGRTAPPPVAPPPAAAPVAQALPSPSLPADRPGRPLRGAGAMGVNEGVSVPLALLERGAVPPAEEPTQLQADVLALVGLGAGVVRANTATYPFLSWSRTTARDPALGRADRWVQAVQAGGLEPLLMIGPWPGNRTASYTDAYVPADLDGYTRWVEQVVERYDGDGVDDMPGLRAPVRYWEVDNEPDLHNSVPPRGAKAGQTGDPASFQTPAQYAQVLVATAAAIRRADPQAVVLSAGFYRPHTESGRAYIEAVLREPGAREAFDVLSLHCYFHEDDLGKVTRTLETWRAVTPDKPLWITETGVPGDGERWIDPQWQGRMVAATYGAFLAGGADRVLWHTLTDPPPGPHAASSPFATHSLRSQDARGNVQDKPAGAVYRRLAGHLAELDPASYTEEAATGGRLLRTAGGWLAFWGQPAAPAGATEYEDLLTGERRPIAGAVPAPAWIPAPDAPAATGG